MQVIYIFSFFLYSNKKKKLIFNLSIYIMPLWHLTCNYGMFINSFLAPFFGSSDELGNWNLKIL